MAESPSYLYDFDSLLVRLKLGFKPAITDDKNYDTITLPLAQGGAIEKIYAEGARTLDNQGVRIFLHAGTLAGAFSARRVGSPRAPCSTALLVGVFLDLDFEKQRFVARCDPLRKVKREYSV